MVSLQVAIQGLQRGLGSYKGRSVPDSRDDDDDDNGHDNDNINDNDNQCFFLEKNVPELIFMYD